MVENFKNNYNSCGATHEPKKFLANLINAVFGNSDKRIAKESELIQYFTQENINLFAAKQNKQFVNRHFETKMMQPKEV